ncbi:hypothetical protein CLPU_1c01340 [Gottschalkia purinilytica]|uniref:DUF4397 domain-containing protein n=1 Tax=Gottschalkia purinilytica TaxID=1503 RepID=A0A0L0WET4_GOTPU|nr:DUF4397 domain-containing protein [Gottschalkia purinilytica]KNF09969.1 hypothetical protein CLPU_1c01340 [Gottschalkia purinilytica]
MNWEFDSLYDYEDDVFELENQQDLSYFRVFHASPNARKVDILANNVVIAENLDYKEFTQYVSAYPGRYSIKVFQAGLRRNPLIDAEINTTPRGIYTLAIAGREEDISLLTIPETEIRAQPRMLHLRFCHLSPNTPRVDIKTNEGRVLFRNVGFKEFTEYLTLDPGNYDLEVYIASTNRRILSIPNIRLRRNRRYTIYAVGLRGRHQDTPLEVVISLDGGSYL